MTRSNPFIMFGAGAALAAGALFLMYQAGVPSGSWGWGPPKKGVVNLYETTTGVLQPGQEVVVYSVPSDRWLTITEARFETAAEDAATGPLEFGGNPANYQTRFFKWGENQAGAFTAKGVAYGAPNPQQSVISSAIQSAAAPSPGLMGLPFSPAGSEIGWVFRPGSQVVVKNTSSAPRSYYGWSVIGYQTRD